ncbi:unnamed protein product [Meloidogyne enterolobii]|uniref:Uncharacterized protein n=1 Tax=Meloidogyne enterolobii TaxID=390850 RepID=A0ACB0ZKA5_MELEN
MHKFRFDCRDCLARILSKTHALQDELGKDTCSAFKNNQAFLKDIEAIGAYVQQIEGDARRLYDAYAGQRSTEIAEKEYEILKAWHRLNYTSDLFRFLNMVGDLLLWIEEVKREMLSHERPNDVSGVGFLTNKHQSLKTEIDTREESFRECKALGRQLLERNHYASAEIEKKLVKLTMDRADMMHRWEDRREYLRQILEVYQFAREAAVSEAWLFAQEPYLLSRNYGRNLEEVVALIKKYEAFEKSAQEERFMALGKLTNFELKEMRTKEERCRRAGVTRPNPRPGETVFPASPTGTTSRSHKECQTEEERRQCGSGLFQFENKENVHKKRNRGKFYCGHERKKKRKEKLMANL